MARDVELKIDQREIRALEKRLSALSVASQKKIGAKASRTAMKPIQLAAKAKAKTYKDTGDLWKSIQIKQKRMRSGVVWTAIGPVHKKRTGVEREGFWGDDLARNSDPAFYAHLVELGHWTIVPKTGTTASGGKTRNSKVGKKGQGRRWKYIAPRPYLRPAFQSGGARAVQTLKKEVLKELHREVVRLSKRK